MSTRHRRDLTNVSATVPIDSNVLYQRFHSRAGPAAVPLLLIKQWQTDQVNSLPNLVHLIGEEQSVGSYSKSKRETFRTTPPAFQWAYMHNQQAASPVRSDGQGD